MGVCMSHEAAQVQIISASAIMSEVQAVSRVATCATVGAVSQDEAEVLHEQERMTAIGMKQNSLSFGFGVMRKQQSDINILDAQKEWIDAEMQDFHSIFDCEKWMLILCTNADAKRPSKIVIIDVDYLSKTYMTEITRLYLPHNGDELVMSAWQRTATQPADVNTIARTSLVVPCVNTSRVYIINIDEMQNMRVAMTVEPDEMYRWNLSQPLAVCNIPGRTNCTVVSTLGDRTGNAKGCFLRLDRRFFAPLHRRRVNIKTESESEAGQHSLATHHAPMGGSVALLFKQGYVFSTEWALPVLLLNAFPIKLLSNDADESFGQAIDIWDVRAQRLLQRISLDRADGRLPLCVRCLHHAELTHAYVCTAIGGCVYHLHKNTRTGLFSAERVARFAPAVVHGWCDQHVPAFPVDMVISMDDQFLYVSCWLQGFVVQFEISDPFHPTIMHRVFMGGVIHKSYGVRLDAISSKKFVPQKQIVAGANFEGGPARLQLSLDGHRLYVSNSFLREWDHQFFPNLAKLGSSIALIQIDSNKSMALDERGGVFFGNTSSSQQITLQKQISQSSKANDGVSKAKPVGEPTPKQHQDVYLAREMRFLNGDSTSDAF